MVPEGREESKASLRERIRRFAFTRSSRHRNLGKTIRDRAGEAYESLRPDDPVIRNGWLFAKSWVEASVEEIEDGDLDFEKREERIDSLRLKAMTEIWAERGFEGVRDLLASSDAAGTVGHYAAACVTGLNQWIDFIRRCFSLDGNLRGKAEGCLQGFLGTIGEDSRPEVLQGAAEGMSPGERTRLFVCAPFQAGTWRLLDDYDEDIRAGYWKAVLPSWGHTPAELAELIDRLLEVRRPRAAFNAVHMDFKDIETSRLKRLLHDIATVDAEPAGYFKLEAYDLCEGLNSLDGRAGVTREEMAQLEFLFIAALEDSQRGIPNLEDQVAQSPAVFVQAVALVYRRSDEGADPPEWRIENPEQRAVVGQQPIVFSTR